MVRALKNQYTMLFRLSLFWLAFAVIAANIPIREIRAAETKFDPEEGITVSQSQDSKEKKSKEATPEEKDLFALDGFLSAQYQKKSVTDSDGQSFEDTDGSSQLRLDITMPEEKNYEFHFFGVGRKDMDGDKDNKEFYPTEDVDDANDLSETEVVYEAHFDINHLGNIDQIRLGRQSGPRDEPVFFDGMGMDISFSKSLKFVLYGGSAVHFYELDEESKDTLVGFGIDYKPFTHSKVSFDYMMIEDQRIKSENELQKDTYMAFKFRQGFTPYSKAMLKYRMLNGEARDVRLRGYFEFPSIDLELNANYFQQFTTQKELSNEMSVFYDILGESHPYHSYDIKLRQLIGENYIIDVGYFNRERLDTTKDEAFNREYSRYFLLFEASDLIEEGLSFSVVLEHWETRGRNMDTTGFDVTYSKGSGSARKEVSAGKYHSLYKYDYYLELGERTDIDTYYIKGRIPLGWDFSFNANYEYEKGIEEYTTYRLGMRYDF